MSDGRQMIQQEIEFLPVDACAAADQMVLAKWVLREVAHSYGIEVSFSPKIAVGRPDPACTSTPAWSRTASTSSPRDRASRRRP